MTFCIGADLEAPDVATGSDLEALTADSEVLSPGLRQRVRVFVRNRGSTSFHVPGQWMVQLQVLDPQAHGRSVATLADLRTTVSVIDPAHAVAVLPYRGQGFDIDVDLRPAIGRGGDRVAWSVRIGDRLSTIPQVVPLPARLQGPVVRLDAQVIRTSSERMGRVLPHALPRQIISGRCTDGDSRWTRIFSVDPGDALHSAVPLLLIDGVSHRLLPDGAYRRIVLDGWDGSCPLPSEVRVLAVIVDD